MICVAVTYVIKPGHEDEAVSLFRTLTQHTRLEPGCRMYVAHRSPTERRRFFLYEQYAKGGLFPIIESRSPEIYEPIPD
ncbi:MAG TPA: antibiotic biosynthesis monooxygenase [Isosphaeraceae bacterium]|nr:antibiotic biosynthesis monooxygenase [Isosphaeraceae bacterium]